MPLLFFLLLLHLQNAAVDGADHPAQFFLRNRSARLIRLGAASELINHFVAIAGGRLCFDKMALDILFQHFSGENVSPVSAHKAEGGRADSQQAIHPRHIDALSARMQNRLLGAV